MIRVVLAGASGEVRTRTADLLAARLGLARSIDGGGFVLADPPADPETFDAELARRGAEVDALVHLGGAPDAVLEHYGRAVVEAHGTGVDGILERLREAFAAAAR